MSMPKAYPKREEGAAKGKEQRTEQNRVSAPPAPKSELKPKARPQSRYSSNYIPKNMVQSTQSPKDENQQQSNQAPKAQERREEISAQVGEEEVTGSCKSPVRKSEAPQQVSTATIGEPLCSAIRKSKYKDQIPRTWYKDQELPWVRTTTKTRYHQHGTNMVQIQRPNTKTRVTLGAYYSHKDRSFAKKMEEVDSELLDNFLLADYNLLGMDTKVTAGQIKSFLRVKYSAPPQRLTQLLGAENPSQALSQPDIQKRREELRIRLDFTTKPTQIGQKLPIIPHFQKVKDIRYVQRTDLLTAPRPPRQLQQEEKEKADRQQEQPPPEQASRPPDDAELRIPTSPKQQANKGDSSQTPHHPSEEGKELDEARREKERSRNTDAPNRNAPAMQKEDIQHSKLDDKRTSQGPVRQISDKEDGKSNLQNRARIDRILSSMGHVTQKKGNH